MFVIFLWNPKVKVVLRLCQSPVGDSKFDEAFVLPKMVAVTKK